MMIALALVCFVAVGVTLGMLGGGGSVLAVPVLVHVLGLAPRIAVPMSYPIVGLTALVGAIARWRTGHFRLQTVVVFAASAMPASYAAARLGRGLDDHLRIILFSLTMLIAAATMWRRSGRTMAPNEAHAPPAHIWTVIPVAVMVGGLTGLLGVGGGFLIVPALSGVLSLPLPEATATSLAVISLNTAAGGAGYIGAVSLDLPLTVMVTVAALVGMAIGTRLAPYYSTRLLARSFALLLLTVGAGMLWSELR